MKIGFNMLLWTTHVTEEDFPLLETLKKVGYDGVEIPLFEGRPAHFEKVGKAIKDNGLTCSSVTVIPDEEHNPVSADAANREGSAEHLKWAIDCSDALVSEVLCGPFYQPLGIFTGQAPTEEEKQRAAEVHRKAAELASKANLTLAVEYLNHFECYYLNTMADAADYVQCVNHSNFILGKEPIVTDTTNYCGAQPTNKEAKTVSKRSRIRYRQNDINWENRPPNKRQNGGGPGTQVCTKRPERVFVIGHNPKSVADVARILEALGVRAVVLEEQPDGGVRAIIEKLEVNSLRCVYAVAILTPDDLVTRNGRQVLEPRPNVVFELGWFLAQLGRDRVMILLQEGTNSEALSDLHGVLQKRFRSSPQEMRTEIEGELLEAGIIAKYSN